MIDKLTDQFGDTNAWVLVHQPHLTWSQNLACINAVTHKIERLTTSGLRLTQMIVRHPQIVFPCAVSCSS